MTAERRMSDRIKNTTAWKEYTLSFPTGASDTQYSHCYINEATKEVFLQLYVTFAGGLVSGGSTIISQAPTPKNRSSNMVALDFGGSGDAMTALPCYFDEEVLRSRTALTAGHSIFMTVMYLAE